LAVPLNRIQPPLAGEREKTGHLNRSKGLHQCFQSTSHHHIFWEVNLSLHRKFSLSENAIGVPNQMPGLTRRH
jgi:hypothetical protein